MMSPFCKRIRYHAAILSGVLLVLGVAFLMTEDKANADEQSAVPPKDNLEKMRDFIRGLPGPGDEDEKLKRYIEQEKERLGVSTQPEAFEENTGLAAVAIFSPGDRRLSSFNHEGFDKANQYYTHLLESYPPPRGRDYFEIQYIRGLARRQIDDFTGALADIEESSKHLRFPDDSLDIGKYFVLRDQEQRKEILERLIQKHPNCTCLYVLKLGPRNPELPRLLKKLDRTVDTTKCSPAIYGVFTEMRAVNARIRPLVIRNQH